MSGSGIKSQVMSEDGSDRPPPTSEEDVVACATLPPSSSSNGGVAIAIDGGGGDDDAVAEPEVNRSQGFAGTDVVEEIGTSCSPNNLEQDGNKPPPAMDDAPSYAEPELASVIAPTTVEEGAEEEEKSADGMENDTDQEGNEDFFEKFSSIRISYENSEKKRIQEFKFQPDEVDGQVADQLWPTLGGWNIDDLYSEVLYALVHPRRFRDNPPETDGLVAHLQQVFHIDNDKHAKLLESAKEKQAPPLVLNLEVVEAKGLKGKDVNGLSDPFCTIFVSPRHKHNTSMKPETLNPVWREYFSLPVSNAQEEVLHIEVWDYDPEETLKDKMKRFGEVKSTRGLRILMKEIALTASTGKQSHEFLGCLKVPLKDLPTEGSDSWCPLESRNGNGHKKKGDIHLKMALGAEKEKKVAAQEYRHVLHLMLVHELDEENVEPHQWEGRFSSKSAFILRTLELQGGLTRKDIEIAQWLVFTRVQCEHPLNAKLFPQLFNAISQHVKGQTLAEDEIRKFWFAAEKLVENFVGYFRNIHQCFVTSSNVTSQVYYMLKTLELMKTFLTERPKLGSDMESKVTVDFIMERTENAISRGAHEFFSGIAQYNPNSDESEVEHLIKVAQLLIADLRKGLDLHHSVFKELLGVEYFDITYLVYDEKYCEIVKPVVVEICGNLKPLDLKNDDGCCQDKDVSMGTALFELYLAVKQFAELSSKLQCEKDLSIHGTFHNWFHTTVAQWLDIAWFKAMNRIRKAVQLDTLKPVDDFVQFTSSAVDTAHIFHQIEIFWSQLSWPEVEGSYSFIAKILDDLCRCTIFYADLTCRKVEEMEKFADEKYHISDELCLAINNIEWVAEQMSPISDKLGMNDIIQQLAAKNGASVAEQCMRTLTTVMENATENINNKIIEVLERVGLKMRPVIQKLLLEGCETDSEEYGVEKLVKYLDKNLIKLKNKLKPATFDKVFAILWENAEVALRYLITTNIEKRRPPSFFNQIHCMIKILISFFYPDGPGEIDSAYHSNIQEMENLIGFYGASTTKLIMNYYQERHVTQARVNNRNSDLGSLTVRAHYCEDIRTLRIELLNARNLKPHDSNGQCDPYVKVKLVPRDAFPSAPIYKTKTKKKTLFPLFDEIFSVPLSPDEFSTGGIIMFTLKDHDIFGRNDFLGECFLPLESIPFTMSNTRLQDLPQMYLPLTLPKDPNSVVLQTLESRQWDKTAAEFVKKERNKMIPSPNAHP